LQFFGGVCLFFCAVFNQFFAHIMRLYLFISEEKAFWAFVTDLLKNVALKKLQMISVFASHNW